MDIGKAIKGIRETRGLRPADMAKGLDMMQSNYTRLEKRGNKLTIEQLNKIAKVMGVTTQDILDYAPDTTRIIERIQIDDVLGDEVVPEEKEECIFLKNRIEELENVIRLQKEVDSFKNEKLERTKAGVTSVLNYIEALVTNRYLVKQDGKWQPLNKEEKEKINVEKITHPFAVALSVSGLLKDYLDPIELEPYAPNEVNMLAHKKHAKEMLLSMIHLFSGDE